MSIAQDLIEGLRRVANGRFSFVCEAAAIASKESDRANQKGNQLELAYQLGRKRGLDESALVIGYIISEIDEIIDQLENYED